MKILKHITLGALWTIVGLYVLLFVLLKIPAVQGWIGSQTAQALSEKLGTEVTVGRMEIGLFNRIIIDDVKMKDQKGHPMLAASRLSANAEIMPLFKGRINITSAQVFGLQANLYQENASAKPNFQFALDSLASKDNQKKSALDLSIQSLIVRHGAVKFDRLDLPPTHNRFNTAHLDISNLSAHLVLHHLTNNEVDAQIKKLTMKEASGIDLKSLTWRLKADTTGAVLSDFELALPHSNVAIQQAEAHYKWADGAPDLRSLTYQTEISNAKVTPSDLASFVPALKSFASPILLSFKTTGNAHSHQFSNLSVQAYNQGVSLKSPRLFLNTDSRNTTLVSARSADLSVSEKSLEEISSYLASNNIQLPEELLRLGNLHWQGNIEYGSHYLETDGLLTNDAGKVKLQAEARDNAFSGHVEASEVNMRQLLDNEQFGLLSANLTAHGSWPLTQKLNVKGNISDFDFNSYHFNDLSIDGQIENKTIEGHFNLNDPNAEVDLDGTINLTEQVPAIMAQAEIRKFNPNALGLTNQYKDTYFEADLEADLKGSSLNNANGTLLMRQFNMVGPDQHYLLDRLVVDATAEDTERSLAVDSDFGQIALRGHYDYRTLSESIIHFLSQKLPMLPGLPKVQPTGNNVFALHADIKRSDWLQALMGIPLSLSKPLVIDGTINDQKKQMFVDLLAPDFHYNGSPYENVVASITTNEGGQLEALTQLTKLMDDGKRFDVQVQAQAGDDEIRSTISWNNNQEHPMKGSLRSTTELFRNERGEQTAHVRVHPSEILIGDTIWQVEPSDIIYSKKHLVVDYFAVAHNRQHIIIQGMATEHAKDSLIVDLSDVDVNYITNLVNFHAVEFGGKVSGKACVRSAFNNPDAYANIRIGQFTFVDGRMGTLFAKARWNKEEKQIDIDAHADEPDDSGYGQTFVKGYISPSKNFIDLAIKPRRARAEFMESFCGSFMDNVEVNVTGDLRLAGDLGAINLTGLAVANGELDITSLNTHYLLANDTIRLIPNEIIFQNDTVRDQHDNYGIVTGGLHHKALTQLTYDIDIAARNMLCYDFRYYGESTFFGTVYGTGNCSIRGRSGSIDFDINVTPNEGSFIEYNAASPDAITNREFITWRSRNEGESRSEERGAWTENSLVADDSNLAPRSPLPAPRENGTPAPRQEHRQDASDLRLNFLINATPECTLRVLMDQESGDYIALNGTGAIRATYYNKGGFDMFGNYLIDHGIYKLTIQNLMKKEFQFQPGSSIVFGGDPYLAALNLNALYTVNGVALSDLQLGRSFSSNNVRVDCLMNIGGTPGQPHVEFDLDMPTVSADAKQMVRQLINSEEEMNQQVIYLLSIGRFYTQNANNADENQSQTSLAMQSLLSGTISQQINNVLGSFVHSSNWNFGANISTGDEGWNNAEYEGLLSGRLLNNRLLINGQFGYRDNANATTSFIGDFDVRYLLLPNGNLAVKVYNQTNDRYFTRSSLNTQGIGFVIKKDFNSWKDLFRTKK